MTTILYPIRLEIQRRLSDLLKTITVDNGYKTEVAGHVYRGRSVYGSETPLPAISILEAPIPLDQIPPPAGSSNQAVDWELVVQGWVEDDKTNPTDPAHVFLADVKMCLAKHRPRVNENKAANGLLGLGNQVTDMLIGPGVVRPADEISAKAFFWLTVTLEIVEDMAAPYEI